MPRKTKDSESAELKQKSNTTASKKSSSKKINSTKKKETVKATTNSNKKTPKKVTTKSTKKSTTKKATTSAKKTSTKKSTKAPSGTIVEYYDLPYRYNQTIVKVLAQTPTNLFIYWDISDEDRENYKKQYGENFFETTKPILKIYNDTMHYSFEVEINDFANSWYLHVNDSKCDYRVELGRKMIDNNYKENNTDYIYISTSNEIESPNDKILFNKLQKMVYFKNVKTNESKSKSIATLSFIRNMGKIYNIYDLYKEIYKNENLDEFNNPTSSFF